MEGEICWEEEKEGGGVGSAHNGGNKVEWKNHHGIADAVSRPVDRG